MTTWDGPSHSGAPGPLLATPVILVCCALHVHCPCRLSRALLAPSRPTTVALRVHAIGGPRELFHHGRGRPCSPQTALWTRRVVSHDARFSLRPFIPASSAVARGAAAGRSRASSARHCVVRGLHVRTAARARSTMTSASDLELSAGSAHPRGPMIMADCGLPSQLVVHGPFVRGARFCKKWSAGLL